MGQYDSAVFGKIIFGKMIFGRNYSQGAEPTASNVVPLKLLDEDMVYIGVVDDYENLTYEGKWGDIGTWEVTVNRYKTNVSVFDPEGFVTWRGLDGVDHVGKVESYSIPLTPEGKKSENWVIGGRMATCILNQRSCMHNFNTGDGYDTFTSTKTETIARGLVTHNIISPTDSGRTITGIALETNDGLRGETTTKAYRGQNLLDAFVELFSTLPSMNYDLIWTGTGYNFVLTFSESVDLTSGNYKVMLSVDFGSVLSYDYKSDLTNLKNAMYVAGQNEAEARILQEVYSGATRPTGRDRYEKFVDASDCSTTALLVARGEQELADREPTESLEFEIDLENGAYTYGTDFKLGDKIIVVFPGICTMTDYIKSVTETITPAGKTVAIGMGKEFMTMVNVMKATRKEYSAITRK